MDDLPDGPSARTVPFVEVGFREALDSRAQTNRRVFDVSNQRRARVFVERQLCRPLILANRIAEIL
jgi:hypothetical protein